MEKRTGPFEGVHPYLIAVGSVAIAALVRLVIAPWLFEKATYMPFFFAVAATAAVGGMRPGLLATALSVALSAYLLLAPERSLRIDSPSDRLQLLFFTAMAVSICWLSGSLYKARRRVDRDQERLRDSERRLRLAKDAAALGLHDYDVRANRFAWDERVGELWGVSPDEPITFDTFLTGIHPDDRARAQAAVSKALDPNGDGKYVVEYRVVNRTNGVVRWIAATAVTSFDDGQAVRLVGTVQDITTRKQAEERVQGQATFLERLVDSSPVAIAVVAGPELRFTLVNPAYQSIVGPQPLVGRTYPEVFPEAAVLGAEAELRKVIATGQPWRVRDFKTPVGDRAESWWEGEVLPLPDEAGRVSSALILTWDITDRKQAEEERRRVGATLNTLIASAPVGIVLFDAEMRFQHINGPLAEMNGVSAEAHIGKTVAEVIPDLYESMRPLFERVLRNGEIVPDYILEGETPKAPGVKRVWRESWFPVAGPDGRPSGVGAIVQEITEQRRAEEQLRFQLDLTKSITDNATTAIFMMDDKSRCTFMNPAAERMTGFRFTEVEGGILHDFVHHHHPDGRPYAISECPIDRALPEQFDVVNHEDVFIRKGGQFFPVEVNARPVRKDGRSIGTVIEVRDVTKEKEAAAALREIAAELSEANRRKDEFLATLAHELRNPLAPIRTGLQVMKLAGNDAGAVERSRRMMERQLEQMVRLVDDLMDVSRITRGKIELRKQRVELATAIESAVEASRPLIDQLGHELSVLLPSHPVVVDADPTRLAQVFANLLNNAAKYTERGGRIRLTVERQGHDVVVSVKDNGVGIPAGQLERVFDMFSQVNRADEKSHSGLGIGLTLVRRLVELHGGRIEARSEGLDKGSDFVVRLPVIVEGSAPTAVRAEPAPPTSTLRLLMVDDNRDHADSLAVMLRIMGHETHTAYDGQEGVDVAERVRPDAILCDIGLPKLNGYDVCRRIREQPWGRDIILIAVTGWGLDEDRRRSRDAGFDHHIVKPVDPNALMHLLAKLNGAKQ